MDLFEAITTITPNPELAVFASTPFTPDSEAWIGQKQPANGGRLDGKEWVGNGDSLHERATPDPATRSKEEWIAAQEELLVEELIPALESERLQREQLGILTDLRVGFRD